MEQRQAIEKIKKLFAAALSHKAQGQKLAAQTYADKAKRLMTAHGVTQAMLLRAPGVEGTFRCSCGFQIQMKVDAGDATEEFVDLMLKAHRQPGHLLKKL